MDKITNADLGKMARDTITSFSGKITAIAHYLGSTTQVRIEASFLNSEGSPVEFWTSVERVELAPA